MITNNPQFDQAAGPIVAEHIARAMEMRAAGAHWADVLMQTNVRDSDITRAEHAGFDAYPPARIRNLAGLQAEKILRLIQRNGYPPNRAITRQSLAAGYVCIGLIKQGRVKLASDIMKAHTHAARFIRTTCYPEKSHAA